MIKMEERKMRNISKMFLLGAGIVLSLAGCQKGTTPANLTGKAIRFSAAAGSVNTRTSFSGDGTQDGTKTDEFGRKLLTWERIDWTVGDAVMIASDNATVYQDPNNTHYATYTVASVTANGDISEAELDEKAGTEELFFTGAEKYSFWGVYPAAVGVGTDLQEGKASYTINGAQPVASATATTKEVTVGEVTKKLTTLAGGMTQGVMLALAENQTTESVKLQFYPAFTAFEFTLNSAGGDLTLKELVLTPAPVEDVVTTSLAGDVVASIKAGGTSTFTTTYPATKALTYTFPDNTVISTTDYLTFTVFALPETIKGLVLEFHMGEDGEIIQKAALKKNGADITFDPCKKYNLRGIAVRGGWTFELDGEVLEWEYIEKTTDFGEQLQTSAFEDHDATPQRLIEGAAENGENNYSSFDAVDKSYTPMSYDAFIALGNRKPPFTEEQNAYLSEHPTYQYNYYQNRTLLPTADYFEFSFTPQAPRAGYWMFEPQGDITMFTAAILDVDTMTWVPTDIGNMQGQIMNKAVQIRLYPSSLVPSTRTQPYSIYFKVYFSSNINFEPALSADSEIQDVHGAGDFSYWHFVIPANN